MSENTGRTIIRYNVLHIAPMSIAYLQMDKAFDFVV